MVKKIDKKIVAYKVRTKDEPQEDLSAQDDVVHMHETVLRPERLMGTTYKLKTPEHVSEHSLFITINDIILNEGTVHETRRPFEIFINSKSLEHYQWIVALTRIISAVFRKGGDVTFLVEELRSVFDPKGGYWNKGKYVPSLIAEIGNVIESHLTEIGMLKATGLDEHQQAFLAEKQAELKAAQDAEEQQANSGFPANAALCYKCHTKALVLKDGCMTCLNCGDSKCG
ncbi:NrdJb [Aeromonas allosaccharophila]|uniref:ribonucleoside-diphosphate reductase n=2 Tax=Aeromonas TaxID=642 RepID=A0A0T6UIS9_9GAMM|nr:MULTISPECIES: NrdJb [Aeromonas]KRW57605.1 NrdJb [Aeromonas allosaccharophila]MCE9954497.1 NrdJb [Aeromonas allosaccharophila]MCS3831288.1 cytochrome c553 [Aeromonas veronii]MEB8287326.1 NrdJb [Aeromonas veronii]OLF20878.1 NrdJb [Aeromonas sp. YN13HZO-058]